MNVLCFDYKLKFVNISKTSIYIMELTKRWMEKPLKNVEKSYITLITVFTQFIERVCSI